MRLLLDNMAFKKHIVKNTFFVSYIFLCSCTNSDITRMTDLNLIKKHIDKSYEKIYEKYNEICSKPRNEYLKSEFNDLKIDIAMARHLSATLINLDYDKQKEISDYSENKIKLYPSLKKLHENDEIECW